MFGAYAPFYAIGVAVVICVIGCKVIEFVQRRKQK